MCLRCLSLCICANSKPFSWEASVSNIVCSCWSNDLTMMLELNSCFIHWKSCSCTSVHFQATFFWVSVHSDAPLCAMSGLQFISWLTNPINDLTSVTLAGLGKSLIARNLSGLGQVPLLVMTCQANAISLSTSRFFFEIVMLCWRHLSRTIYTLDIRVPLSIWTCPVAAEM